MNRITSKIQALNYHQDRLNSHVGIILLRKRRAKVSSHGNTDRFGVTRFRTSGVLALTKALGDLKDILKRD